MRNIIIVTGGAGFIGSNLIELLIKKTSYQIISIAKFFSNKLRYIPEREGESFKSSLIKKIRGIKINNLVSKIDIKNYIEEFKLNTQKKNK